MSEVSSEEVGAEPVPPADRSPPLVQELRDQGLLNHTERKMRQRAAILASIIAVVGLGVWAFASRDDAGDDAGAQGPESVAVDYERALAGAPPALAALYARGDALIDGGPEALEAELAKLDGHPVVVNVWASWCGPCREEFPYFQSLAAKRGDRVAFLGVDSQDADAAAETFLADYPLPYPSVTDPDKEVQNELGLVGLPGTAFYDSAGELAHLKHGPYLSEADLAADIDRYAR